MKRAVLLAIWSAAIFAIGFIAGVYTLPILTAPRPTPAAEIESLAKTALFRGEFRRDLKGSDALHWGEGTVSISARTVSLVGKIAPGPDYKLYLAPEFVETEAEFERVKPQSVRLGDVKSFENFVIDVPATVDVAQFTTAIVWCEAFSQFITAAQYRQAASGSGIATAPANSAFLVVYRPGPTFKVGKPLKEQDLKAHGQYMLDLYAQGAVLSGGGFVDDSGGAWVANAADLAAAQALVQNDPAVRTGLFLYDLHPWRMVDWEKRLSKAREATKDAQP
jgi:uncharacterized protein YciI